MNVKDVKATINFNLMYGDFSINISNTHERKISFNLSEKKGKVWVRIPSTASNYILQDFKKTDEYKKIELIFKEILKDYSY